MFSNSDGDLFVKTMFTMMVLAVVGVGFLFKEAFNLFTTAEEQKPTQIAIPNTELRVVEDTLNPDDSRIVSRVTINKQKFLIFKLGGQYYAFEEK